jgi:hypothetical protein
MCPRAGRHDVENRKLGKTKRNPKKYSVLNNRNEVLQTLGLVNKFHTGLERVCLFSTTHLKILDAYVMSLQMAMHELRLSVLLGKFVL